MQIERATITEREFEGQKVHFKVTTSIIEKSYIYLLAKSSVIPLGQVIVVLISTSRDVPSMLALSKRGFGEPQSDQKSNLPQ